MEPIVSSETSAIRTQTPGNYPKRNKLHDKKIVSYVLFYCIFNLHIIIAVSLLVSLSPHVFQNALSRLLHKRTLYDLLCILHQL